MHAGPPCSTGITEVCEAEQTVPCHKEKPLVSSTLILMAYGIFFSCLAWAHGVPSSKAAYKTMNWGRLGAQSVKCLILDFSHDLGVMGLSPVSGSCWVWRLLEILSVHLLLSLHCLLKKKKAKKAINCSCLYPGGHDADLSHPIWP